MKKLFYEGVCPILYQEDFIKILKNITPELIDMIFAGPP